MCYRHYRQAIAKQSLQNLEHWQLPASQLFGQTYDGAGSMAGKRKGVAAKISDQYPKTLHTHCASHCSELVHCELLQHTRCQKYNGHGRMCPPFL